MRIAVVFASFLALAALPLACSETTIEKAADPPTEKPTDDAGTPTTPQDVPVVALESDPKVECPAGFQDAAPKVGVNKGFAVAGQEREFNLILPSDTSTPRPLFVGFNGTSETGASFSARAKLEDFAAKGFIVLAPSSIGNGENWPIWDSLRQPGKENEPNKDLEYFDKLVKCVAGHHPIDKNRIYVGGHSAGGIMTNHVLQRRSSFLAGGIPASGVFSLTSPDPVASLDPMFVIVTWGGDNDKYSGTAGGVSVGGFNFVTEASLASKFYDSQTKVAEINCRGADLGHAWLDGLNGWFADRLLAHPKGLPGKGQADLAAGAPASGEAVCKDSPYDAPNVVEVTCQDSAKDGCKETCQLFGDCAVENGTVGPALASQLSALGFSGANNANCGGCVANCEAQAKTASDTAALACFKQQQATASCTQGINGAYPLINAVNDCCEGRSDSPLCVSMCTVINTNGTAKTFFPTCSAIGN